MAASLANRQAWPDLSLVAFPNLHFTNFTSLEKLKYSFRLRGLQEAPV